jgi:dynein heavy chain
MQMELIKVLESAKGATEGWRLEMPREIWLESYNAQISLLATQIVWTEETLAAFEELESGAESAMKENLDLIRKRIGKLIERVRDTGLTIEVRVKIITIITVDVHARDICDECVVKKIMDSSNFLWQRQLKFGMEKHPGFALDPKMEHQHCIVNICDWMTWYSYEYVGNCGRLVITPLTDRCYITLTQALNLQMGAAPAGPAGTGKTETTKDLARALGLRCVVYNCSDQMNFRTLAAIFMGLSQSGFWGCFDEFNRISIEVLSVVSSQVRNVLEALIAYKLTSGVKNTFIFMNADIAEDISIKNTVGFFITMNPGYAGRTELPENLKAQFRYCAMVVPDMVLICENMLMSEGFETAKELAKKFMTLYDLCKSLLSGMVHYDWGLRAVKSLLRSAGGLKRADLTSSEDLILMKALRDFNIAKIVEADISIFMGLIKTLFPGMEAEAVQNTQLREACCEVAVKANLQTDPGFILKCEQMFDILQVRHSIFLIGASGLGKSATWKNLAEALSNPIMNGFNGQNWNTIVQQVDPKAVSSDELCGWENLKTKEWRDGVLSSMFRNMVKNMGKFTDKQQYKWVVMDGDVDPEWIESLNTVMDDNKVLTLVSNERIPLTPEMRLIIEVANLRNATPATVSRGGVLFINNGDIGW